MADTTERTGIRCDTCGDTIVPAYPGTAEEMAGDRCSKCGDGFFELVDVETVPVERVVDRLDQLIESLDDSDESSLQPIAQALICMKYEMVTFGVEPHRKTFDCDEEDHEYESVYPESRIKERLERVRDELTDEQGDGGG